MSKNIYELNDGKKLGVIIFEIVSFPIMNSFGNSQEEACQKIAAQFTQIVAELYKLCSSNVCIEFLWLTEKVQNQIFSSKIRIFSILRKIGENELQVNNELNNICKNIMSSLSSLQFNVQEIGFDDEGFTNLLSSLDESCMFAVTKREKCIANSNSIYPYYFCDVVPHKNKNNFNSLIATLSQCEKCCVSFQLFPIQLSGEELYMINEVSAELERIVSGTMFNREIYRDSFAIEPLKVYSYYNERKNSPMFMYNLLTFGERSSCANIATKLVSLLQSGEEKITISDFACFDLSKEKIQLSSQLPYYVWNVNNVLLYKYRNQKLLEAIPLAKKLNRLPYVMSADEVVSFYRLPLYEKNMVALKSNQVAHAQEQFSDEVVSEKNIKFGDLLLNENVKISIGCPEKSFTKHALIVGTPGSGKTTFSVNLLLQFAKRGIPFLAIEPTKTEYRAMIDAISNLQIFTPGNNSVSPYIVNPFIPPKGIKVEQYIPSLVSAFKAAFSMPSPLDMIFLKAIKSCYIKYGWKDYSKFGDADVTLFGLHEFILEFKRLLENTNYSKDVRSNLESAGFLRLANLIEQNSNIYDTINTIPIEDLLTAPTVLELNSIDNAEQKSLVMALLLINICIYTKHNHIGDGKLKNAILIDEAHVLLGGDTSVSVDGSPNSQATTVKALQDMIAEIRSYGTSIIIADQSPTKVSREVIANTDIKISFRLVQSAEKQLIADSTNMDDEAQSNLSRLKPGEAYVYYSKLDAPQMVVTEDIREEKGIRLSVSDFEVAKRNKYWLNHSELLKPYSECDLCHLCNKTCDFNIRSNAEYIANSAFNKYRNSIKDAHSLKKCIVYLPQLMKDEMNKYSGDCLTKIKICSRIKLLRKIELELSNKLSSKEKQSVILSLINDKEQTERE